MTTESNTMSMPYHEPSIDYYHTLPTEASFEKSEYSIIQPKGTLEDTKSNICFRIVSDERNLIDTYNTYIYTECQIVYGDNKEITAKVKRRVEEKTREIKLGADGQPVKVAGGEAFQTVEKIVVTYPERDNQNDDVVIVNGIGSAMFRNIIVKVNETLITQTDNLYAYKADLSNRLFYPIEVKRNSLSISGFYANENEPIFDDMTREDIKGKIMNTDRTLDNITYTSFHRRVKRTFRSKPFFILSRIHSEIFEQGKLMPPTTAMDIEFNRSDPKFAVLSKSGENFHVRINRAVIITRLVTLRESKAQEMALDRAKGFPMLFPMVRTKMHSFTNNIGLNELAEHGILQDIVPRRIFIALVDAAAFHGNQQMDPFNYQHFNAQEINVRVGNKNRPLPRVPINWNTGDYEWPLFALLKSIQSLFNVTECGINEENYPKGNAIYGFNLSSVDCAPGSCYVIPEKQNTSVSIKMAENTTTAITVVIMAEYDAELRIWGNGKTFYTQ